MYLLEGRGSSREERRSATLNRVALTSLKLAAGAVAAADCELDWRSAMFEEVPPILSGEETVSRPHSCRKSFAGNVVLSQLSPR